MEYTEEKLYKQAYLLSLFTIIYNIVEGIVSMIIGYYDKTLPCLDLAWTVLLK